MNANALIKKELALVLGFIFGLIFMAGVVLLEAWAVGQFNDLNFWTNFGWVAVASLACYSTRLIYSNKVFQSIEESILQTIIFTLVLFVGIGVSGLYLSLANVVIGLALHLSVRFYVKKREFELNTLPAPEYRFW